MNAYTDAQEKAAEHTFAKRAGQWALPALLVVLAFFGNRSLNGIEQSQKDQGVKLEQVSSDVRVMNTRIEYSLIEQIKSVQQRVEKLEQEVEKDRER